MALKLDYENEQGQKIEYWRIGRIFISFADKIVNIYVQGYVSEQARLDNKLYVEERIFNLPETIYDEKGEIIKTIEYPFDNNEKDEYSLRPTLYNLLKQFEFFKKAIDC